MKRYSRSIPGSRYMSVRMGQLRVADIREVLPGDYIKHRVRIGVHLSPMQAPELAPLLIRTDTFFVANRILWNYWDNYISQKLLEDSAVGPFDENKLLPPQIGVCMGAGFNQQDGNSRHLDNVRGIFGLAEDLGLRLSYTDEQATPAGQIDTTTGTVYMLNAFACMAYWRIWHDYFRDPFLQNDEFHANSAQRVPLFGDPWADERPSPESETSTSNDWDSPLSSNGFSTSMIGHSLPGYCLSFYASGAQYTHFRGIFSFAKRQPATAVGIKGSVSTEDIILPGCAYAFPADLGGFQANIGVLPPNLSLFMPAPVCMPKDYVFTARQSPVYNADVATPGSVRDLRKAFQVLGYREKVNRFDNRIKAWLYNMFHVKISDKRIDSPFWLHGSQNIINTQEVLGTVNNTDTVLGQLGGFGIGAVRGRSCKMRSEDHGFLITTFYIVPTPVYGDGVRRYWYRGALQKYSRSPLADGSLDWPLPDFARIGQQNLYLGEVSFMGNRSNTNSFVDGTYNHKTGGYVDRYSELDFPNADVCGDFRTTLRFWHTGLFFGPDPQANSPTDDDLSTFTGVSGDFVSLFPRLYQGQALGRLGTIRSSIAANLSARLFDAGLTADQFWCVVSSDYYVSSRLPSHPHPGYADHTSKVL